MDPLASSPLDPLRHVRHVHDVLNGTHDLGGRRAALTRDAPRPGTPVALPEACLPDVTLAAALRERRSRYDLGGALTVDELAALLGSTLGLSRRVPGHGRADHPLGISPTAGGLRSVEAHVVVRDVAGLPPGVHRYDLERHALAPVRPGDPTAGLRAATAQPEFAERAAAVVALVGRLDAALARYGPRHYRTLHVDAGIAVQSLYLACTALGLAGCAVAGYDDAALDDLLGLGETELTLVLFAAGRPPR